MTLRVKSTLTTGVLGAIVGVFIGLYISLTATGAGYEFFPLASGAAAFITAAVAWWFLLARKGTYSIFRGILAGILTGLASHYVCWYLTFVASNICYTLLGGCRSSLGEPPADLISGLSGALGFTFFSLLFFGWMTIPLGGLIGGLLAWFYKPKAA